MPSVLRPNLKFLASRAKSGYSRSTFLHCDPSAGCLNIASFLRSSMCHRNNLACSLFLNKRFNRGIIGAYHITLAGTLFLSLKEKWREEKWREKMAGRKMEGRNRRKKNGSFNTYTVNKRNMTLISMLRYICVPKMAQLIHIVNLMIALAVTMEYQHRLTGWLGQSSL